MVEVPDLARRYGDTVAIDASALSSSRVVTGILGPNVAGKSTTMRVILELDHPIAEPLVDGRGYRTFTQPLRPDEVAGTGRPDVGRQTPGPAPIRFAHRVGPIPLG